jgi:hypothetical protein
MVVGVSLAHHVETDSFLSLAPSPAFSDTLIQLCMGFACRLKVSQSGVHDLKARNGREGVGVERVTIVEHLVHTLPLHHCNLERRTKPSVARLVQEAEKEPEESVSFPPATNWWNQTSAH